MHPNLHVTWAMKGWQHGNMKELGPEPGMAAITTCMSVMLLLVSTPFAPPNVGAADLGANCS